MTDDQAAWIGALLTLDLCLGGAAALSIGRALARAWRPYSAAVPFAALLAAAVGFLHYAIFGLSPIPLYDIGDAIGALPAAPLAAVERLALDLTGWFALTLLLSLFAWAGWRRMRRRQMTERYDWLYESTGALGWRARDPTPRP